MSDTDDQRPGILGDLADDDFSALTEFAKRREFAKHQEILKEGEYNASLFIVTSGLLHARMKVDKTDTLLGRLEPGTFFGEVSVFDPGATSASVVALTKGALFEIERDQLLRFVDQHPTAGGKLLLLLLQEIARRIRAADDRLGDAIFLNRLSHE